MGGLTGALFTEFAFTLVGTVTISAIIALTLSPMMCSRLLKAPDPKSRSWQDRLVLFLDRSFERLHKRYERTLHGSLDFLPVTAVMAIIILGSIYYLYSTSKSELAPQEDQGVLISVSFNNPDGDAGAASALRRPDLRHLQEVPRDRPRLPAQHARRR